MSEKKSNSELLAEAEYQETPRGDYDSKCIFKKPLNVSLENGNEIGIYCYIEIHHSAQEISTPTITLQNGGDWMKLSQVDPQTIETGWLWEDPNLTDVATSIKLMDEAVKSLAENNTLKKPIEG